MTKQSLSFSLYCDILNSSKNQRTEGLKMTEQEKKNQQYSLVVKSNDLIRQSRFSLSLTEQKILLYLISKIKPEDKEFKRYEFDIKQFCEICNIEYMQSLSQLKEVVKNLRDKSIWIHIDEETESLVSWINKAYLKTGTGKIGLQLDSDLIPYLLQLKSNFTQYELIAVLALRSKFSLRIYEILKSYEYIGSFSISIEDFRRMLMLESQYAKVGDLKHYVIDKAIAEINEYTDLLIYYESYRDGRRIAGFKFSIQKKENWDGEYYAADMYLKERSPSRHKLEKKAKAIRKDIENQTSLFEESEK